MGVMGAATITDARTIVGNSGVANWDWGDAGEDVLDRLAEFLFRSDEGGLTDELLARFIREELRQDPRDYDLGRG